MIARKLFSSWVLVGMAGLACAVVLIPWSVAGPSVYRGLDPNLLYVDAAAGGRADFDGGRALVTSPPDSTTSLHVVTTLDDFSATFTATVLQADSAPSAIASPLALQVRLWHPNSGSSVAIRFLSTPEHQLIAGSSDGSEERLTKTMGGYKLGVPYQVFVDWKAGKSGAFRVVSPDGTSTAYVVDRTSGLALFDDRFVNLTFDSIAAGGTQRVEISDFSLVIPPQTTFGSKASDPRLTILTLVILAWFLAFATYHGLSRLRPLLTTAPKDHDERAPGRWATRLRTAAIAAPCVLVIAAVYAALAPVDAHPYDRLAQESYAYVSDQYGPGSLYDRTSYIPDAAVRGGLESWTSPPFAYPPVMAYPYWLIGKTWHVVRGPIAPLQDRTFQVFWKLALALFVLANAAVVYYVFAGKRSARWAIFAVALYALNPAVVFDAAGWGETEAIVTTALLVSAVGFVTGRPRLGWSSLIVGTLLKQTALFALPVMAIYSLKKYGLRQTLTAGSTGLLVGFSAVSPLILIGYHPATIYKSMLAQILNFAKPLPTYASSDTFSIWTLVDGIRGLRGFGRIWAPYPLELAGLSFSNIGTVCFFAVVIADLWLLWRARADRLSSETLFLSVAAVMTAYVAFSTAASARYLLLAVPFLILSLASSASRTMLGMIGVLSTIAFLSMYGVLMEIAVLGLWPVYFGLGNPSTNELSRVIYQLYTSDVTITVLAIALLLIMQLLLMRVSGASGRTTAHPSPRLTPAEQS